MNMVTRGTENLPGTRGGREGSKHGDDVPKGKPKGEVDTFGQIFGGNEKGCQQQSNEHL